jgi:hypothetical protein
VTHWLSCIEAKETEKKLASALPRPNEDGFDAGHSEVFSRVALARFLKDSELESCPEAARMSISPDVSVPATPMLVFERAGRFRGHFSK